MGRRMRSTGYNRQRNGARGRRSFAGALKRVLIAVIAVAVALPPQSSQAQFWGFDLPRPGRKQPAKPNPTESNVPHPAVVRVVVDERSSLSHGSGVLVALQDEYGLVVTNWHVVRDVAGPINVIFPSGFTSPARIIKVDKDWDLAALGIWNPNTTPIPIAKVPPRVGDALSIAGYGSGQYRSITGRCNQFVSPGDRFPYEMVEVSVEARRGDSGGPILNQSGEVAGVLFGASSGTTSGSHSGRLRRFLGPWTGLIDQTPVLAARPPVPDGKSTSAPTTFQVPPAVPPTGSLTSASSPFAMPASTDALALPPPIATASPTVPTFSPRAATTNDVGLGATPPPFSPTTPLAPAAPIRQMEPARDDLSAGWSSAPSVPSPPPHTLNTPAAATPFDHARNVLAIVGVLAVLLHLFRRAPAHATESRVA